MELTYPGKKTEQSIIHDTPGAVLKTVRLPSQHPIITPNHLIHGDNLQVMKALLLEQVKVDLIYIDPPFARNTTFRIGKDRIATVSKGRGDDVAYHDKRVGEEFIEFLRERLILLRELLSSHGSIYLHIDDKIGHYVKVIMDEVFGREKFRNDISRIKCNPKNFTRKAYGNVKDVIFFYNQSDSTRLERANCGRKTRRTRPALPEDRQPGPTLHNKSASRTRRNEKWRIGQSMEGYDAADRAPLALFTRDS